MSFHCECSQDGYCPRYRRDMGGRLREICAGVNVDLGTASAFRAQWTREAGNPPNTTSTPIPLLLKADQAPGDMVAMTAAVWSIHRAYPGRYATAVESRWPEVFAHNPDVSMPAPDATLVCMHYPAIHQSNQRGIHFIQAWCEFLGAALGIPVPLLTNRPHLYFADPPPPVGDYWIICSGGKNDFTNKLWGQHNYQSVVRMLAGKVKFVQVGGSKPVVSWNASCMGSQEDNHPPLDGTENRIGQTSLRELFDLVRRARGVLCGVSLLMHVAAALEKPAVVVAGGREPVAWNAYPRQQYVHTIGALPCRSSQGGAGVACWRSRVVPLGNHPVLDQNTCERPIDGLPECMRMIRPEHVVMLITMVDTGRG